MSEYILFPRILHLLLVTFVACYIIGRHCRCRSACAFVQSDLTATTSADKSTASDITFILPQLIFVACHMGTA